MDKKKLITTAFAAAALSCTGASADNHMEKCKIVNSNGAGIIKAHRGDCASSKPLHSCASDAKMKSHKNDCATRGHSCAGNNEAGDPNAWIYLDTTICKATQKAVMQGKIDDIPDSVKKKIDLDMVK